MNVKNLSLLELVEKIKDIAGIAWAGEETKEWFEEKEVEYNNLIEEVKRRDRLSKLTFDQIVSTFVE